MATLFWRCFVVFLSLFYDMHTIAKILLEFDLRLINAPSPAELVRFGNLSAHFVSCYFDIHFHDWVCLADVFVIVLSLSGGTQTQVRTRVESHGTLTNAPSRTQSCPKKIFRRSGSLLRIFRFFGYFDTHDSLCFRDVRGISSALSNDMQTRVKIVLEGFHAPHMSSLKTTCE